MNSRPWLEALKKSVAAEALEELEMNNRPWLEALKKSVAEEASEEPDRQPKETSKAPGGALTKPARLSQSADETQDVTDTWTAGVVSIRGEDERRLIAAGWEPKERCGLIIWASPETGFYCSQEVALHRLEAREGAT